MVPSTEPSSRTNFDALLGRKRNALAAALAAKFDLAHEDPVALALRTWQ